MELPDDICGYDPRAIRDAFKSFVDLPIKCDWVDGEPKIVPKLMTAEFLAGELGIDLPTAGRLVGCLTADGWLKADRAIPETMGMALAQHIDRPRLARAEADKIFAEVLQWAADHNRLTKGDIRIEELKVYGSYTKDTPDVGDIDLIVISNYDGLTDQGLLQPKHDRQLDAALKKLKAISEYVSPANAMDMMAMPHVDFTSVYRR